MYIVPTDELSLLSFIGWTTSTKSAKHLMLTRVIWKFADITHLRRKITTLLPRAWDHLIWCYNRFFILQKSPPRQELSFYHVHFLLNIELDNNFSQWLPPYESNTLTTELSRSFIISKDNQIEPMPQWVINIRNKAIIPFH